MKHFRSDMLWTQSLLCLVLMKLTPGVGGTFWGVISMVLVVMMLIAMYWERKS